MPNICAVAQRAPISAKLKKHAREYVGACPVCGGKDRFAVNPTKKGGVFFCRGFGGGDVIAMVQHVCGVTFLPACEIINGMLRKINFWAETLRRSRGRLPAAARNI